MDLIDVNKDSVTLMKYIGPFSPRITTSDSETLTNIFISKGSLNMGKTNPSLNPLVGTNTISDVNTSDLLKANLGTAGINKAVKHCTNLSGGLVDSDLANKSLHSLTTGESSHHTIGMSGIKMVATPHLDHTSSKSGIKSSIASGLTSIHYSTASGLRDVHQSLRSGFGGAHLGIKKGDSNSLASSMISSMDPRKGLTLLDNKMKIAPGGCVLDVTGLDAGSKLDHGKVKVNPKSLNKGDMRVLLPAIFANCQFALDLSMNMSFSEKTNLRKTITSHGGTVSFIVTKKSTHVICSDQEKADTSYKCKMATKYGIPIISVDFVRDCTDKGRLLNTDNYLLSGKTKAEELKLGKISASRQQKQETKQKVKPHFNVKNVKVWKFGEKDCPVFDEENYQIAKYAMFKKLDKSTETTAFCVLELHVVDLKVDGTSEHKFRVFCHHGILHNVEEGKAGDIEIRFAQTSEEVVAIYAYLYLEQMKPPHSMTLTFDLLSRHVGSQKFKQMIEEIGVACGVISPAVSGLVNYVWEEAVGNLEQNLKGPLTSIKTEQIDKAEGILKQMREAVDKENTSRLFELKDEFYKEIPYHQAVSVSDINKAWISRTFDLCQLIRDLIAVSEATDWSAKPSDEAKYSALRCNIEHLESTSPEFKTIKDYLMQSLEGGMSLKVERIFHVHRLAENSNFRMDLEPRKLLFHSSRVENFMGIFSRGLLMPRVVVDDHGGKRTDPGMLGSGIYFAEAGSTSAGYSTPGKTKGTRLMLINEVALGSCFGTTKHSKSLTEPPEGYQSVHGIKATENCPSDFKADEYVVYNTDQQKIKYLVEFTLPGDKITAQAVGSVMQSAQLFIDRMDTDDDDLSLKEVDLKDVTNVIDPVSKVKAGLVSGGDAPVDLKKVHISARLLDMVSQVIVIQEYYNNSSAPLEAKYVFPLDEMAAVCGFEAFINGKHIIGEVKEKETAHKEYKKAISEGHGAYLMDQDEETPDVFTISVGNLPPGATVFIKITYVAELQVEEELISFRLPGSVAPWSKDAALQDMTQSDLATVEVKQGTTSLLVSVEMPFDIRTIECPTHKVNLKKTLTKAVVELCSGQSLSDGFQLLIGLAEIHVPRMWVERKDIDSDHQACMLSFYPEFEASEDEESDVTFLLDLSNSMKGAALTQAKKVLLLTLTHIPKQWTFNVIVFGTAYRELFPGGVCKTPENVKKVEKFVQGLKADMGNTEALRPLHSLHLLKQESSLRNVFLITDGHVNNEETTLAEIHCHCQNTRIFTFGVSSTANRHLLRALARMGGGAFEFFDPKSKSKWESKVKSQISKAGHIGLTSISVHWEQYDSDVAAPVQAPQNINAIFSGSRQVIYGFVPNCTMATLKAEIDGQEISTVVSTSDLSITAGKILHSLTARAIIRDWEDGLLSLDRADQEILKSKTKNMIIELSKEYSIVTQFTSFVAIEKRDEDKEVDESELLTMNDLIEREAMDILQSMEYSSSSSSSSENWELFADSESVVTEENIYDYAEFQGGGGGGGATFFGLEDYSMTAMTDSLSVRFQESDAYEGTFHVDDDRWGGGGGGMDFPVNAMPRSLACEEVAVMNAEEEESCEELGLSVFGDDDGITGKAQSPVMEVRGGLYMKEDRKVPSPVQIEAVRHSLVAKPIDEKTQADGVDEDTDEILFGPQRFMMEKRGVQLDRQQDETEKKGLSPVRIKADVISLEAMSEPRALKYEEYKETYACGLRSFVKNAEEEESCEDMAFGLFGDDDGITRKSRSPVMVRGVHIEEERIVSSPGPIEAVPQSLETEPERISFGRLLKNNRRSADETQEVAIQPASMPRFLIAKPRMSLAAIDRERSIESEMSQETGLVDNPVYDTSGPGPSTSIGSPTAEYTGVDKRKKKGEALHPESTSPSRAMDGFAPLGLGVRAKMGFHGKQERPQIESVVLAPPEIQSASLFESAPSQSHVPFEGHDTSHSQPVFGFGASTPSTLPASFASQQMFPSQAAFGFAAPTSSVPFGSQSGQKLSQKEQGHGFRAFTSEGHDTSKSQPVFGFGASTPSTLPASFASQQMFPSQAAFGFAAPTSSVPFGSQSGQKFSQKEQAHGFRAFTSEGHDTSKSQPVFGFGASTPSTLPASFASQQMFPSQAAFGFAAPTSSVPFGSQSGQKLSQKEQGHGFRAFTSEGHDTSKSQPVFGFGASTPSTLPASFASQQMFPSRAAFGFAAPTSSVPYGSQSGQKLSQKEQAHGFRAFTSSTVPVSFASQQMFPSLGAFTSSCSLRSQPMTKSDSLFGSMAATSSGTHGSQRSQGAFEFASTNSCSSLASNPDQSMLQSYPSFKFASTNSYSSLASNPDQSMLQTHPSFEFASFTPTDKVTIQPSCEFSLGAETISAPFRSQPTVISKSLFRSTNTSSSFGVAEAEKVTPKELHLLPPPPPPLPPPPPPVAGRNLMASSPAPNYYDIPTSMCSKMSAPLHQKKPPPPPIAGRDLMASPPAPDYYEIPMSRKISVRQQQHIAPLSADLEESHPLPSLSSLNISAIKKAHPPPAPSSAAEMSPSPISKRRQRPLPNVMHLETNEVMTPQSMQETLSTVSWRACSVPTVTSKSSIYEKSEVPDFKGDFERIQSRSIARMEHEPLLDSHDKKEESLLIEGGMLDQVVTTDLGRYGIGVSVECIAVRPVRGLPADTVDHIMKLQKEDGHWEFDADLEEILGVDKNLCLHLLYTAGLKSMGESAIQAIIQLAATLIVLLSIYKKLFPSSHLTNLRQVDQQNNVYNKIWTAVSKLGFGQQFDNAIAYCNRMKKQHSLVPATLELGKSWEEMVGKMLDIHAEN